MIKDRLGHTVDWASNRPVVLLDQPVVKGSVHKSPRIVGVGQGVVGAFDVIVPQHPVLVAAGP